MADLDLNSQSLHLRRQIVLLRKEESNVHLVPRIKTKIRDIIINFRTK